MPGWDEQSATQGVKAESSSGLVFDAHREKKKKSVQALRALNSLKSGSKQRDG